MKIDLSYVIATYNRLPFLKITLEMLSRELQPGEEIVVVDGNSTDGSKEYLQQLFDKGLIHQFLSEKDKNQAHAWNKAFLAAKGTVIKKIIDDDVFCYTAIRECKNFMLDHPDIDVVISNDLQSALGNHEEIARTSRLSEFEKWQKGLCPSFTFGDVHMLVRKSALAYIGLYHTGYIMMDWEYSLRISYLRAGIAYYTGYNALSVAHPQTISTLKTRKIIDEQGVRGAQFYEYKGDASGISFWSKIKIAAGKFLNPAKSDAPHADVPAVDLHQIYEYYYGRIDELNSAQSFRFLF